MLYQVVTNMDGNKSESCPLCGEEATCPIQGAKRNSRHCPDCDLIFVPAAYHLSPEEEVHRYLQHQNSLDNPGYVNLLSEVLDLVRQFGPAGRSLLDYGSGPEPVFVNMCRQAGYDAVGYDLYFSQKLPGKSHFDIMTSIEVWEHFRSPAAEIRRLRMLMAPDGLLAVRTLLHEGKEKFASWWYARDNTHLSFYSLHTMEWIAQKFHLDLFFSDGKKLFLFSAVAGVMIK